MNTSWPTLYQLSSVGVMKQWDINVKEVDGLGHINITWGQVGGAMQTMTTIIREGKNAGKKNATTAIQQAYKEADSKYQKQVKSGYVTDIKDAKAGRVDNVIKGGIEPMLASKVEDVAFDFPVIIQPKLDGHRCIAIYKDGKCTLWSRTRKQINSAPHIEDEVETMCKAHNIEEIILDGELYNHNYRDNFEDLTSLIRSLEPKPGYNDIHYHIYDIVSSDRQIDRIDFLRSKINIQVGPKYFSIKSVNSTIVHTKSMYDRVLEHNLNDGYEGSIIRMLGAKYQIGRRSKDLLKVKQFDDAEFVVTNVKSGVGSMEGRAIFECITNSGEKFSCKMKGKLEDLEKYVKDPSLAIGRIVTVRYFGMTNANNVPRFPVVLRFREDL